MANVDLDHFRLTGLLTELYELVFGEDSLEGLDNAPRWDQLTLSIGILPRTNLAGDPVEFSNIWWLLEYDDTYAAAMYSLKTMGMTDYMMLADTDLYKVTFSVRNIARLGYMSEASVRNAMSKKTGDHLTSFKRTDGKVRILPDVAIKWLSQRRGFRPRIIDVKNLNKLTPNFFEVRFFGMLGLPNR